MTFTAEQLERYSRHIILKGVGVKGQKALLSSGVLVVGAGALGSPAIMFLAASGVGHIGIADFDPVELTNLQRQIIHKTEAVGTAKVLSAKAAAQAINPYIKIDIYEKGVNEDNIDEIIREYDFIIDGTDRFSAKFLINDACVKNHKPFCYGGIKEFSGQIMTYVPGRGPCLRCIFDEAPPDDECETCSDVGVLGTLPGVIGTLQALEAQKYIIGTGDLLIGQMLVFDGLRTDFRKVDFSDCTERCPVYRKMKEKTANAKNHRP
ncbi:MAG: HesA/MoeB/ThiF family protein [Lachnospiraceae bacterium]|nr:HesA/MoeB/ThiF family protein [Lachnospiraceae bacterium]